MNKIIKNPEKNNLFVKKKLCKTLMGNDCFYLTITSNSMKGRNFRKGILLMSR